MRVTITEEVSNFSSLCYSDRAYWESGPGQEVLLRGLLAAGCPVRLVDKDLDSRG